LSEILLVNDKSWVSEALFVEEWIEFFKKENPPWRIECLRFI
jgi:hypothetical protein